MQPKVELPRPLLVLFTGMYHNYCYSTEYMATSYDCTQFNFLVFYPRTICADPSSLAKPFQLVGHQAPALSSDTDRCHLARRCDSIIWAIIQHPLQWTTGGYALSPPLPYPISNDLVQPEAKVFASHLGKSGVRSDGIWVQYTSTFTRLSLQFAGLEYRRTLNPHLTLCGMSLRLRPRFEVRISRGGGWRHLH